MSYEQQHSHEGVERLAAALNGQDTDKETKLLLARMVDIIEEVAREAAADRVATVCEWLRSITAEEIAEGGDLLGLPVNRTLAEAVERRFGGAL